MDITEVSILHHIVIVLAFLWMLSFFSLCPSIVYFLSFVYLYLVNERYTLKLQKRLQFEERKQANQRRLLSDSETVRWLNHAVEKVWPICMEQIASQKFLLPIVPWFLEKYKPWTVKTAVVQQMYLGRSPPMFTEIRVLGQSADDDHLVLELGMNFLSADDMSSVLAVKLRKRLGFGMWAKMHITGMHLEGKVLVGVKFLRQWPFLGRLRVCFAEPPYFQMTVKPIFNHGINVTELPGIAGWLDKILSVAFEQTLVEPNMLVVDVEKFASAPTETWFSMDEKCPIAFVKVEILEAADMKPSDLNGLADPYVKGQLGPYTFRTRIQRKTLTPKWQEEFKIPIFTWESPSVLRLQVHDKDHIFDDSLGYCSIPISDCRDGQRHDKWLPLQNIKTGRLHLAVTVVDVDEKEGQCLVDEERPNQNENMSSVAGEALQHETSDHTPSSGQAPKMADEFEPINIEGQEKTGVWVHRPGSDVSQTWEPRKRTGTRRPVIEIHRQGTDSIDSPGSAANGSHDNDSSDDDENPQVNKGPKLGAIRQSLRKFGSIFHKSATNENHNEKGTKDENPNDKGEVAPTPYINIQAVHERGTGVTFVLDDNHNMESPTPERNGAEGPDKGQVRGTAKGIIKQAGKSAALNIKHALSRKGSKKTMADPGSPTTERDASQGSDVIDEESPSSSNSLSPRVESISVGSAFLHGSGKQSAGAEKEPVVGLGPSASAVDIMNPIARKVSFRGGNGTGNNTASTGESLAVEVSLGDKDSPVGYNGIQREFVTRDASISGADGMKDDGIVGCSDGHGQGDVEASSDSKVHEGTL